MKTVAQIGLDSHRLFSEASARDAHGELVWRERLEHEDREQLRRQLRRWPRGVPVVLEGTFGWGWMSDELEQAGLRPHWASSKKVAAWRDARGLAKSSRIDGDLLSELWSQQPRWWEVWLAPPEVRDRREWMRYRTGLVAAQTQLKNRMHAVLHRHGIVQPWSDLFGREGRAFLAELAADAARLRETARAVLAGHLRQLAELRGAIARATREIRRQLQRHGAVRSGGRFRAIFDRITDGGRKNRNRGYIAVAHELCRIAYALWTQDRDYTENRPTRPGSQPQNQERNNQEGKNLEGKSPEGKKQRRRTDVRKPGVTNRASSDRKASNRSDTSRSGSRPGTGQPEFPMVGAVS